MEPLAEAVFVEERKSFVELALKFFLQSIRMEFEASTSRDPEWTRAINFLFSIHGTRRKPPLCIFLKLTL